jgi:hypothetical protein
MAELIQSVNIKLSLIESNKGQIEGLPANPRIIKDAKFHKLVKSIEDNPEMIALREILVYQVGNKYIVIGGNMRLKAMKQLGYKEAPCKIIPPETTIEQLKAYTIKDNSGFGDWDFDSLDTDWDITLLEDCCIEIPEIEMPSYNGGEESEEYDDEDIEFPSFEHQMVDDVLYESNNAFEIPNLLLSGQGGKLQLPLNPWGANSRLRKDVSTYHFYVDDYRFEKLWKDPIDLINSGCKAIVEPNCSLHDQTPIAYGIHLIYKKRWLARYMQELGVKVYADLNVSRKFREYNRMGIPQGYNAFFTRGMSGWLQSLIDEHNIAKEISGKDTPNLIVYGGGDEIKEYCRDNNLLYVTDFINDKVIGD